MMAILTGRLFNDPWRSRHCNALQAIPERSAGVCNLLLREPHSLTFIDLLGMITEWLQANR
jgi:hypothetical protein